MSRGHCVITSIFILFLLTRCLGRASLNGQGYPAPSGTKP